MGVGWGRGCGCGFGGYEVVGSQPTDRLLFPLQIPARKLNEIALAPTHNPCYHAAMKQVVQPIQINKRVRGHRHTVFQSAPKVDLEKLTPTAQRLFQRCPKKSHP